MFGGNFKNSDPNSETFRFVGASQVPIVVKGRGGPWEDSQIMPFKDWQVVESPAGYAE
jgi:hypothetical protein